MNKEEIINTINHFHDCVISSINRNGRNIELLITYDFIDSKTIKLSFMNCESIKLDYWKTNSEIIDLVLISKMELELLGCDINAESYLIICQDGMNQCALDIISNDLEVSISNQLISTSDLPDIVFR
jgi:hypothetical protein